MASESNWQYSSRSHEVEEVIGTPASLAARYGTMVLFVLVVLLFLVGWSLSYPTFVESDLTLTSVNPPRLLRARQDFTIAEVLTNHRDTVEAGQTILVANRNARFEHVAYLEDELIQARSASDSALLNLSLPTSLVLGELEGVVAEFRRKQEDYRGLVANRLEGLTSAELRRLIRDRDRFIEQETRRRVDLEDKMILARRRLEREESLNAEGIQNRRELTDARIAAETTEERLQRSRIAISDADYEKEVARNRLENFNNFRPGNVREVEQELREAFERLQTSVSDWKRDYTVVSPVRGVVLLAPDVREKELVFRETNLATVIPVNAGDMIGRMDLELKGSGRVAEGQRVVVRFDNYPYLEFGAVEGVVISKSTVPYDSKITIQVAFSDQLVTTTGQVLEPSPLMEGEAFIETGSERLLTRFLDYLYTSDT